MGEFLVMVTYKVPSGHQIWPPERAHPFASRLLSRFHPTLSVRIPSKILGLSRRDSRAEDPALVS